MSVVMLEVVGRIVCDRTHQTVELLEERVYPGEVMPAVGQPFHVRARMCSLGLECNLAGYKCRWAFTNPEYDPFETEARERGEAQA